MPNLKPLDTGQLYQSCDPAQLPFQTTGELAATTEIIGQNHKGLSELFQANHLSDLLRFFSIYPKLLRLIPIVLRFRQIAKPLPIYCKRLQYIVHHFS